MLVDYEFGELVKTPERVATLGFSPQSEALANHLLPYAAELDTESTQFLEQVKTNLAKSVMLREMKPACGVWSSRLMKYIRMYGLKFSKEDHIAFIKLAYELVLIPDLEPCKIHKFSTLFIMLTKKRYLIAPEELTLPWRPLYEMGRKIFYNSNTNIGMYHYLRAETVSVEGMMQRSFREFNQIVQADNYRKQLLAAEKEYTEKCSTPLAAHLAPLATFYDTAAEYVDVLNDIMPILLSQSKVAKELVPGKVLIVSCGPYINQLAVYLNGSGPRQTPYKVLVLNTAEKNTAKYNFDLDENWYRILGFSSVYNYVGTDESTMDHTIVCIAPKHITAITKMNLKFDEKIIIQDWEKRQMPRFKDAPIGSSCASAVQELSRLSHAVRTGATTLERISLTQSLSITTGEILQSLDAMKKCESELEALRKSTEIANFKSEFAIVHERKQTERKRDKYKRLLSFENLALYPDYQRRRLVLRELNYIDDNDSVILKGRVACGMCTNELILAELVFRNVFTDKNPAEIAALLSCFVFQAKTNVENPLTDKLAEGVKAIEQIDQELCAVEAKYMVSQFEGQQERINFGLVRVVYEWALEKPFAEIMDLTDVQEGIIVRCIQQLHELLVDVKDAAAAIGDPQLQAKMMDASTAIKRDIVFAASLYTSSKEAVLV